ncbi:hypothetical protein [Chitinophaga sp.]|uniref:hypothetical protein n=1 Tax=Chitinophaga sp. TaxID=1869181 RepID=UPI0031D44BAA
MKLVMLLLCFHLCCSSYSYTQSKNADYSSQKKDTTTQLIIDSLLSTNSVVSSHRKTHFSEAPVSIADSAFLNHYKIRQVVIDGQLQTGHIPDIPAAEICNINVIIYVEKGDANLLNTLIIETRSFVRQNYWQYFSAKSGDYRKAVPTLQEFKNVTYYINNYAINTSLEEELSKIRIEDIVKVKVDKQGVKIKVKKH